MKTSDEVFSTVLLVLAITLLLSYFNLAFADMRCGTNLIDESSTAADVREYCGTPDTSSGTILGKDSDTYRNKDKAGVNYEIRYGNDDKVQQINEDKHW